MRKVKPDGIWWRVVLAHRSDSKWLIEFNGVFHATVKKSDGGGDAMFGYRHSNRWKNSYIYWNRNTLEIKIV